MPNDHPPPHVRRWCGTILPVSLLTALALFTPITFSGALYLIGALLVAAGAITAPWRRTRFRGVTRAGMVLICLVACIRLVVAASGTTVTLITLPGGQNTRWLDRLVPERDIALFGVQLAYVTGTAISPREHEGLMPALQAAYAAMGGAGATTSSPCLSTYLGRQHPGSFDTVVIEPAGSEPACTAVVFLHGFTGNFTVQGWLLAQAAGKIGAVTVCPSVGWRGDWWTENGQQTVRNTLDYLHARGIKRVYLAGLSNGAVGTCRLAPRLSSKLSGLILISGGDPMPPTPGFRSWPCRAEPTSGCQQPWHSKRHSRSVSEEHTMSSTEIICSWRSEPMKSKRYWRRG